jgi:ABC-2 type transport system ATP-binding protein
MTAELAIEARHLTRRFGDILAVNDISFSVAYGEIFGYLGANGAGKTTTMRMLCGILAPTSGTASVAGCDINRDPESLKRAIGYVSQRFSLYNDLTVRENLRFYGRIYGMGKRLDRRLDEILSLTGLSPRQNQIAGTLSGGWKQRLAIANAMLHEPRLLFLDEPTAGLDPISRRTQWELLYQLADQGVALFVTTHYMEEAERCNQVAILSQGKLLRLGSPAELKAQVTGKLLEVDCSPLMKAVIAFEHVPGVTGLTAYGTNLHVNVADPAAIEPTLREAARQAGVTIRSITPITASLEDVFAAIEEEILG